MEVYRAQTGVVRRNEVRGLLESLLEEPELKAREKDLGFGSDT